MEVLFCLLNATGAKDTLWLVLDSDALPLVDNNNPGFDPQFGEYPIELDPEGFNVWTPGGIGIFLKTFALPLNYYPGATIYANNYVLPITLSWDTALFRAPVLLQNIIGPINAPLLNNDYFFNYHANLGWPSYCMLYDTQVEMPWFSWGSQDQFPLMCTMSRGWGNPLSSSNILPSPRPLKLYPNPMQDLLRVESTSAWYEAIVLDAQGKVVLQVRYTAVQPGLDVSRLPAGAYILHLVDVAGEKIGAEKFVKH